MSRCDKVIRMASTVLVVILLQSCLEDILEMRTSDVVAEGMESFIYFTDPHLTGSGKNNIRNTLKKISAYHKEYDYELCICGGDWLVNNETYAEAYSSLEHIQSTAEDLFSGNYYPVLGNHDTNYQGRLYEYSGKNSGRLTYEDINQVMFDRFGKAYYSFETDSTAWFILDSGIDWETDMSDYRWEQVEWFCRNLQSTSKRHAAIVIHIYANYDSKGALVVQQLAENVMKAAEACNAGTQVQLNGKTYDFSSATCSVGFALCGHNHIDYVLESSTIPVICTRRLTNGNINSFDLCSIDWDLGKLTMRRVGQGNDRTIDIFVR